MEESTACKMRADCHRHPNLLAQHLSWWSVRVCVLSVLVLVAVAYGADDEASSQLEKLVAMQRAWGSTMNSAGATLELKEVSRSTLNGHIVVKYRMTTSGLPADRVYSLVIWQTGDQPQTSLSGVTLDGSGTAICAGKPNTCGTPDKPNDPVDLNMTGGLGEVKRVGLVSSDRSANAFASAIPFPIRAIDNGCALDALLVTPNAEAVRLFATGFKPGLTVEIESVSEGEKQHRSAKADEKGHYEWIVLPFKKGLSRGRAQVSVRSDACKLSLSFAWGSGSYALQ